MYVCMPALLKYCVGGQLAPPSTLPHCKGLHSFFELDCNSNSWQAAKWNCLETVKSLERRQRRIGMASMAQNISNTRVIGFWQYYSSVFNGTVGNGAPGPTCHLPNIDHTCSPVALPLEIYFWRFTHQLATKTSCTESRSPYIMLMAARASTVSTRFL